MSRCQYILQLAKNIVDSKNEEESKIEGDYQFTNKENISPNISCNKSLDEYDFQGQSTPLEFIDSHNETLENNLGSLSVSKEIDNLLDIIETGCSSTGSIVNNVCSLSSNNEASILECSEAFSIELEVTENGTLVDVGPESSSCYLSDVITELNTASQQEAVTAHYQMAENITQVENRSIFVKISEENIEEGNEQALSDQIREDIAEKNRKHSSGQIVAINITEEGNRNAVNDNSPEGSVEENQRKKRRKSESPCSSESDSNTAKKRTQKERRENYKLLRLHGQEYKGIRWLSKNKYTEVERKARKLNSKICPHEALEPVSTRSFMCGTISEKVRQNQFKLFWNIENWSAKKCYIKGLVDFRPIIKRRKELQNTKPLKRNGYDCYLPNSDGIKVRVCRQFFLSTLDIQKDMFGQWVQDEVDLSNTSSELNSSSSANTSTDNRKEKPVGKKTQRKYKKRKLSAKMQSRKSNNTKSKASLAKKLKSDSVLNWLKLLPKVPSHYCRANTSRVYVEPVFLSYRHMHGTYEEWCSENSLKPADRKTFMGTLKEENVSIYKPRKDQCDTCVGFKEGNITEEQYSLHTIKKDEARLAKQKAISTCSGKILVATMDVQSILLCPKLLVSQQYYKKKLQIHNFTIYVNNNKDVHCYVWNESDGQQSSNEFASCILDFLENSKNFEKVILISDGCAYQNKNRILCSALSNFSIKNKIEVEQIILEKGHTMMEVDSVHSTLEHCFKPPIYTPADYVSRMRQARRKQPYLIHHVDFSFFKNYESLSDNFPSIRPGKRVGDPTVADIRGLLYTHEAVYYKLRHTDDWVELPQRRATSKKKSAAPPALYKEPLKLEKSKVEALQSLKSSMHKDHHPFYDNLKAD